MSNDTRPVIFSRELTWNRMTIRIHVYSPVQDQPSGDWSCLAEAILSDGEMCSTVGYGVDSWQAVEGSADRIEHIVREKYEGAFTYGPDFRYPDNKGMTLSQFQRICEHLWSEALRLEQEFLMDRRRSKPNRPSDSEAVPEE